MWILAIHPMEKRHAQSGIMVDDVQYRWHGYAWNIVKDLSLVLVFCAIDDGKMLNVDKVRAIGFGLWTIICAYSSWTLVDNYYTIVHTFKGA